MIIAKQNGITGLRLLPTFEVDTVSREHFVEHFAPFGWFEVPGRRCEVCACVLPVLCVDGQLDTFPRCSRHAF